MILAVTRTPEGNAIITEYMSGGCLFPPTSRRALSSSSFARSLGVAHSRARDHSSLHLMVRDCFFTLETQPGLRHKIVSGRLSRSLAFSAAQFTVSTVVG